MDNPGRVFTLRFMTRKRWLYSVVAGFFLLWPAPAGATDSSLIITPDAAQMPLDDLGLYTAGYQYRGQKEQSFPAGWTGDFEEHTGVALEPVGDQNGRPACLLHPPWRGGTGVAFQEFTFHLPPAGKVQHIRLTGATALRQDALAEPGQKQKSDGVTFRLYANGRKLLDEHRASAQWQDFSFDLTDLAGRDVALRFETDPGPRNDASFDFALWGARALILDGFQPPAKAARLAPPPLDWRGLYSVTNGEVAPPAAHAGPAIIKLGTNTATFTCHGDGGTLTYEWTPPQSGQDSPLGRWQLRATPAGRHAVVMPFAGDSGLHWSRPATFKQSRLEAQPDGAVCVSTYDVGGRTATFRNAAKIIGQSLVMELSCDVPEIAAADTGRWGPVLHRRAILMPYYSGRIFYFDAEDLFAGTFLDWTASGASTLAAGRAVYGARTDGTRNNFHERVIFSAAWHVDAVLPNIPNPPSPFRGHLADKIILDTWGGPFDNLARTLTTLHDYGLDHCYVIVHDWQRSGYDNALPAHVPASEKLGGEPAMKNLVATAKQLGYDIALHENYVDYYPNYEGFNENDIALDANSNRVKAWFNPGTQIQSFAVRPDAILPLARGQSPQIRERYQPNADYLDVHSAVPPWFHVDYRAGAARLQTVREAHRQLWAFERETYGGPVTGEGANHWYWSGLLDGVEAQFGAGWPANAGRTAPLLVDFDLLKIHPLQFNHGMGYYERWWGEATWGWLPPMEVLDQYRMQEVVYGHAGFLGGATYAQVPLAWLEHHLLSPVTARYGAALPVAVQYQAGGAWVDSTAAAKAGVWNRVRITYDSGLVITANQETNDLPVDGVVLPPDGWLARGGGVTAWTARLQGVIADYAETPDSTFANARPAADWNLGGIHQIRPSVAEFKLAGSRAFTFKYQWRVDEAPGQDCRCFVHFVRDENIVFQNDHALSRPAATWQKGETVDDGPWTIHLPAALADGDYGVRLGLYLPDGPRLALAGPNDGQNRIRAGTLHVRGGGGSLSFDPEPVPPAEDDLYLHRLNLAGKVLDFGDVRTDGSVLIRREGGEWVLRALPRTRPFFVELSAARFGAPARVRCVAGAAPTVAPEARDGWWRLPLNGAHEYHW
ncbi:MAG: DUF5696 domain-containing protein [Verrucomicrobiae bacterium]|nr:DUF5696 domain-containing protein [Verrucomicrobiae bacterium]